MLELANDEDNNDTREALLLGCIGILKKTLHTVRNDIRTKPKWNFLHPLDYRVPDVEDLPAYHSPDREEALQALHRSTDGIMDFINLARNAFFHNPPAPEAPAQVNIDMTVDILEWTGDPESETVLTFWRRSLNQFHPSFEPSGKKKRMFREFLALHEGDLFSASEEATGFVNGLVDRYARHKEYQERLAEADT